MQHFLHLAGEGLAILGSICMIGIVVVLNQLYANYSSQRVRARIVEWIKDPDAGESTQNLKARLVYTDLENKSYDTLTAGRHYSEKAQQLPPGAEVSARYIKGLAECIDLEDSFAAKFGVPGTIAAAGFLMIVVAIKMP
jgi:hypothetical protein